MVNLNPGDKKAARKRIAWQIAAEQASAKSKDAIEIYEEIIKDFEKKDKENQVVT